ncbi:TIGR02757 family protein [Flavihumibacter sp. CACIAM 22H1]|uniref:TIGR02757 family protein n=1 Tax=Flavihumibacter sp. CACIAM 22H1 TaxID=1812911 RepID=UPI000A9940B1|nr:TIGR02757 family protein [Flavihumibacter sp. CACIAM 22H1]
MAKGKQEVQRISDFLNRKVEEYNRPSFIEADPVCIPHLFSAPADIEIAGLFAAVFAWGNRTTIISKSKDLLQRMDMQPHAFVQHHGADDLRGLLSFKHRTFTATDLLYFVEVLKQHYLKHASLEQAFLSGMDRGAKDMTGGLNGFYSYFFDGVWEGVRDAVEVPSRTRKHIAAPFRGSTCKRLNMYLRWMVRPADGGVDFGLWSSISPAQLVIPIDLHVARVAKRFGLLQREAIDWQAALELTAWLRRLDPSDPVKYDYALFALGVIEKF